MMKFSALVLTVATILVATGCNRGPDHTLAEYEQDRELAKARLQQCQSMTTIDRAKDQDCAFALTARHKQSNSGTVKPARDGWMKN